MVKFFSKWWNEIDKFNFIIIIAIISIGIILSFSINNNFIPPIIWPLYGDGELLFTFYFNSVVMYKIEMAKSSV